jgi:hypothetical protein
MRAGPVLQAAASTAGLAPRQIATSGPFNFAGGQLTGEARANQLIGEGSPYRMTFDAADPNAQVPIITIYAQAPTARVAEQLADGAAAGLATYVSAQAAIDRVAPANQVVIRQLSRASGAVVASGAAKTAAITVFIAVWGVLCALIIAVPKIRQRWRGVAREERENRPPWSNGTVKREPTAQSQTARTSKPERITDEHLGRESTAPAEDEPATKSDSLVARIRRHGLGETA